MRYLNGQWVDGEPGVDAHQALLQLEANRGAEDARMDRLCVDSDKQLLYPHRGKQYAFTPTTSSRRVVERSRPRDAGPTLRHYWKMSQENLENDAYKNGYRSASMSPPLQAKPTPTKWRLRWTVPDASGQHRGQAEHFVTKQDALAYCIGIGNLPPRADNITIKPEYNTR